MMGGAPLDPGANPRGRGRGGRGRGRGRGFNNGGGYNQGRIYDFSLSSDDLQDQDLKIFLSGGYGSYGYGNSPNAAYSEYRLFLYDITSVSFASIDQSWQPCNLKVNLKLQGSSVAVF